MKDAPADVSGSICGAVSGRSAVGLSLAGVMDVLEWEPGHDLTVLREWYRSRVEGGARMMVLSPECGEVLSRELFEKRAKNEMLPVVVILPGGTEDKRARELVRRAVGLDLQNKVGGGKA